MYEVPVVLRSAVGCLAVSTLLHSRIVSAAPVVSLQVPQAKPPQTTPPKPSHKNRTAIDEGLKTVSLVEGSWSLAMSSAWSSSANSFSPPYPYGVLGFATARVLYGTSWTLMLVGESGLASLITGGDWSWIQRAEYRSDWLFGFDLPSGCREPGADGGCGYGLGGYSELSARVAGRLPLWLSIGGGWLQGRHSVTAQRTLVESTWVAAPIVLHAELKAESGPLTISIAQGPGIFFGMHNTHAHPKEDVPSDFPWHELFPIEAGIGAGWDLRLRTTVAETVSIEGTGTYAPFPGAYKGYEMPDIVQPFHSTAGEGLVSYRRVSAGALIGLPSRIFRVGVFLLGTELSSRPVYELGHRALTVRFDMLLR